MDDTRRSFSFLVLAYNHEQYIVEHLESIKYLVNVYGKNIDVDIIINDDASKDLTTKIIGTWLDVNGSIFREVHFLQNDINIGTCRSVFNMFKHISTDAFKLTAGDDVYSFENIFKYAFNSDPYTIVSGIPLDLTEGVISENKIDTFNSIASDVIYNNSPLIHRYKHLSYNNAPNIIYPIKVIKDIKLIDNVLTKYDVIEDWPLQIYFSACYPQARHELKNTVLVYYRRTLGSTYIIANKRFMEDKIKIYDYLLSIEDCFVERFRLKMRKWCFLKSNKLLNKFMNIDFYCYVFNVFLHGGEIIKKTNSADLKVNEHTLFYDEIKQRARVFYELIEK